MIHWRSYFIPVCAAFLLHAGLLLLLAGGWLPASKSQTFIEPNKVIKASLVQLKKAKPKKKVVRKKVAQKKVKPPVKAKPTVQKNKQSQKTQPAKPAIKKPIKAVEIANTDSLLDDLLAAEDEAMLVEDQQQQQQENTALISQYGAAMRAEITNNWSRPPSARNEMVVVLEIQLLPTGDVVNVAVVESSGNIALDRSALLAVEKVGRFTVLQGMPSNLFEAEFRRTVLRFKPSDLRL